MTENFCGFLVFIAYGLSQKKSLPHDTEDLLKRD